MTAQRQWTVRTFDQLNAIDVYKILQIRQVVFIVEQQCLYLDTDDWDQDTLHMLAWDGPELVAYCRIFPPGVRWDDASIGRVIVAKSIRGTGTGNELMERANSWCDEHYRSAIVISAQAHLQDFYRRHGYRTVSEEFPVDDIPHVDMRRDAIP